MSDEARTLGDAIRDLWQEYLHDGLTTGALEDLADRADALERGGKELGRILDRELTAVLDLSGAHHLIDEDGDGDWGAVWDILGALVEKGKRADALEAELVNERVVVFNLALDAERLQAQVDRVRALADKWERMAVLIGAKDPAGWRMHSKARQVRAALDGAQ